MGYDDSAGRDAGEERPTMSDRVPIFVELCAGTAALSLRLEHPRARPPVSRMGAKTGYADVILRCMGLRPGQGAHRYLFCEPDQEVRLLLHAYRDRELATAAADIIRGWKDEDPRALWERLRAEGPAQCPPVDAWEVARWAWIQCRTLHEGVFRPQIVTGKNHTGGNRNYSNDAPASRLTDAPTLPATIADDAREVDPREVARFLFATSASYGGTKGQLWDSFLHPENGGRYGAARVDVANKTSAVPTLPATITDDARKVDPREVARWATIQRWMYGNAPIAHDGEKWINGQGGQGGVTFGANNFGTTETTATGLDKAPTLPATITDDARAIDPPQLPPGVVVYIDPPYLDTTGYAHAFPRSEWVPLVRRWQAAGAMVVVSEAEPILELMADGWHAVRIDGERKGQKRTFSKQQAEWLTMSEAPRWRPSVQMGLWSRGSV